MAFLKTLFEQLKTLWNRWTNAQRVGISLATVACVAAVVATFVWATRADYVVLANELTPQRAAEIVGILDTEQIATQLNYSGSAVSVPRSDVGRARLALKDIWEPTADTDSGMSGAFPGSPREEEDRRLRKLEARIAQSIVQIRGIRSATVHISRPDPSPFVSEQVPTTASVLVDASSGAITPTIGESIISLVARAVEGLAPDQISLMDTVGRQFNVAHGVGSSMDGQFDHQHRVELRLASKAESMLATLLGHGKAVVRVSADIDFRETTRTDRKFDPDGKVKTREEIETVKQTGGISPGGDVGVGANVLGGGAGQNGDGSKYDKELISADYDNPSTEEIIREVPGKIIRLTVAAIVDLTIPATAPAADTNGVTPKPPVALDPTQIEAIVKQAVGFDEMRGDEIQVMTASLESGNPAEVMGVMNMWNEYEPMIRTVGMGLIAFGAFLMAFLLLRKLTPVVLTEPSREQQLTLEEVRHLAALSEQAKSNPEVAAKILEAWLGQETAEDEKKPNTTTNRAA